MGKPEIFLANWETRTQAANKCFSLRGSRPERRSPRRTFWSRVNELIFDDTSQALFLIHRGFEFHWGVLISEVKQLSFNNTLEQFRHCVVLLMSWACRLVSCANYMFLSCFAGFQSLHEFHRCGETHFLYFKKLVFLQIIDSPFFKRYLWSLIGLYSLVKILLKTDFLCRERIINGDHPGQKIF